MKKKIIFSLLFASSFFFSSVVFADGTLTIQVNASGCPTGVSDDGSCPGRGAVCRDSGARVRWVSNGNDIESIHKKSNSGGELQGCNNNGPGDYQCAAVGASGTHINYNVQLAGCSVFDPTIIIR